MNPSIPYTVAPIPVPPSILQASKFASLRLLALKSDPSAFGSTFERESAFTQGQWMARLSVPERATMVLPNSPSPDAEWVGTIAVLVPSDITFDSLQPLREAGVADGNVNNIYVLVGMWVRPDHRRKGLGKKLVQSAIEYVRDHAEARGAGRALLALQVSATNMSARSLYIGMGFQPVANVNDEHEWLIISVA